MTRISSWLAGVGEAWRICGLALLLVLAIETCYRAQAGLRGALRPARAVVPHPYADSAWYPELQREQDESNRLAWRPYVYFRRLPFAGKLLSVDSSGRRTTVQASGPYGRLILLFGGSTMFGTDQRDAWTIPSQFAREMRARGHSDVVAWNFGETGYVFTQSVIELQLQLRAGLRPDVVLFYDGINDVASAVQNGLPGLPQNERNRARDFALGRSLADWRTDPLTEARVLGTTAVIASERLQFLGKLRTVTGPPTPAAIAPGDLADDVARMYVGTIGVVEALAARYGFTPIYSWQPALHGTQKTLTAFERELVAAIEQSAFQQQLVAMHRAMPARVSAAIPSEVSGRFLDLSRLFDGSASAVFTDVIGHTTELGSQQVAAAIAAAVDPVVRSKRPPVVPRPKPSP